MDKLLVKNRNSKKNLIKKIIFGAKLGVVGGVLYMSSQYGVWKDSKRTEEIYREVYSLAAPYFKEIPVEFPELPKASEITSSSKQYWNCAVLTCARFIADLPSNSYKLVDNGIDFIVDKFSDTAKTDEEKQ